MAYEQRLQLYEQIETLRKRPLIAYVTSLRQNASGQMASDVIPQFAKQISEVPEKSKQVDLAIVSQGGDPTVSWRVISLLRERFDDIGVLLPYAAYSAATLLALGANEIVMHPFSHLGPVDPQMTIVTERQERISFSPEDLRHFLEFVRHDVGISDQEELERAFELVCKEVPAVRLGMARRSSQLSLTMGEQLLGLHMEDSSQVKAIAEALNTKFYHHGYPVGPTEAEDIGLPVKRPPKELEQAMWALWEDFEEEMECNVPFDPIQVVLNDEGASALLAPVPQVQLPANLPPELLKQAYHEVLQQIAIIEIEPIKYSLVLGALESMRCRSHFVTDGRIMAMRLPDTKIAANVMPVSQGWTFTKTAQEV